MFTILINLAICIIKAFNLRWFFYRKIIIIWTIKELNEDVNIQKRIAIKVIKIETEDDLSVLRWDVLPGIDLIHLYTPRYENLALRIMTGWNNLYNS